ARRLKQAPQHLIRHILFQEGARRPALQVNRVDVVLRLPKRGRCQRFAHGFSLLLSVCIVFYYNAPLFSTPLRGRRGTAEAAAIRWGLYLALFPFFRYHNKDSSDRISKCHEEEEK